MVSVLPVLTPTVQYHESKQASPHRNRLLAIPDLRFEQSYLRSIAAHLHTQQTTAGRRSSGDPSGQAASNEGAEWREIRVTEVSTSKEPKGKSKVVEFREELGHAGDLGQHPISRIDTVPINVVHVDWSGVAWITLRDQFISPLLQGALWCVWNLQVFFGFCS